MEHLQSEEPFSSDPYFRKTWNADFIIVCQNKKAKRELIQNLAPSTIVWRQCDIRMESVELRMLLQIGFQFHHCVVLLSFW